MFYRRDLTDTIIRYTKFPVVAVLGPRQSGKTTLVRNTFANHTFLSFDDPEVALLAKTDPKGFLRKHKNEFGVILDEFQNIPELLPYIKVVVDEEKKPGYFILTGSHNFLANQAITQSLAGRVALLTLLPFSLHELSLHTLLEENAPEKTIFRGGYPQVYIDTFTPSEVYPSYIRTYIERDVRQLINVSDLYTFQKFMKLCAARIGQLVNFSDLAVSCGISVPTVHKWLSMLESSYILFLLKPFHTNFNKRIIKTPKLYFYDTGIACSLLEITSAQSVALHPLYGSLFESLIVADLYKQYFNQGSPAPIYFWRDKNGTIEVDSLLQKDATLIPIEIKSGETFTKQFFQSLLQWNTISATSQERNVVIYGGQINTKLPEGNLVSWHKAGTLIQELS